MEILNSLDLFRINQAILKNIDSSIVSHGEETAYIAYMIAKNIGYEENEINNIIKASILHDIGAYKTEEIKMLRKFEAIKAEKHCVYGYIILNNSELFKDISEYVLYHHHSYKNKDKMIDEIPIPKESFLIGLADRVSIYCNLLNYNKEKIIKRLYNNFDSDNFNPKHIDALFDLIENDKLIDKIIDNSYKKVLREKIKKIYIDLNKIKEYLVLLPLSINLFSFHTSIHTVSVSSLTKKICDKMNLKEEYKNKIEIGAYLHDIGKVCIPKNILDKDSKLTKEEFEIIKNHVVESRNILQQANINEELINLACNHHEKLDGSGYPQGLCSDDLSLGDRIISISDIFCALTEKRPYKKPYSKEEVLKIFTDMVYKNYIDKDIVDIVFNNYEEFLDDINQNKLIYEKRLNNITKKYNCILDKTNQIYR